MYMKKIILIIIVLIISGAAYYFFQNSTKNVGEPLGSNNKKIDIASNPNYCEKDSDCIAVKNPSNGCYYGYFNKDATDAINEFKNNSKPWVMDCPTWGEIYCDSDNICTADRDNR